MGAILLNYLNSVLGIYKRWGTWRRFSSLLLIISIISLIMVQTEIADGLMKGDIGLTWQPWVATFSAIYSYTFISPFIIHCCESWSFSKDNLIKTPFKLIFLYVPTTLLYITVMLSIRNIAHILIDGTPFDGGDLLGRYIYEFPKVFLPYWGVVFFTYTKIYYDSSKEEQLNAVTLENELQNIQMQSLRSQLQPQFLFSTLKLISSTVYTDADKADTIIARLGDLLRYSLATEQKPFVTLKEELQAMKSYLEISQLRFGERMAIEVDVKSTTELVLIPTMLLQPLLENAVKYGIEPSDNKGEISLTTSLENSELIIRITNPWHQRRAQQESFGIGLSNTKNRLTLIYEDLACVELETRNENQIVLQIRLPVQQTQSLGENSNER